MKIGQYCQRQSCRHVELEQFWQTFASRGFVSDSWAFLFFPLVSGGQTPQRTFTQNGSNDMFSRKNVPFAVKVATFFIPLISRPPNRSKFCKFLDFEIFRSILAFNIRGHRENTPYSSSGLNESGIVNRQSGGEKLKYILKFYIGGTCHVISRMRNDDLALCLWAHTIRYDTIGEFNVHWKAEYSALSSTRSQKKKLKQPTPVPL